MSELERPEKTRLVQKIIELETALRRRADLSVRIVELEATLQQRNALIAEQKAELSRLRQQQPSDVLERQVRDQRREIDRMTRELREYRQKAHFFERAAT